MIHQTLPELPVTGVLDVPGSNASQNRDGHGLFRYFGKLAPDVTREVLLLAAQARGTDATPIVLDPMCGSGTTLVEADLLGWSAIGSDINPVALLYSRVKTRSVDRARVDSYLEVVLSNLSVSQDEIDECFSRTVNAHRWFSLAAMQVIAALKRNILSLPSDEEKDLLLATLLSRLRRISNASASTGRIFYDPASATDALRDFEKQARLNASMATSRNAEIMQADARATNLASQSVDVVLLHPPYFALYRYSSDVLRFELEIGGFDRRAIAKSEIKEGWKSGDPENLKSHIDDMEAVMSEMRRVLRPRGSLALVTSNSTLGDRAMPVIDELAARAQRLGLVLTSHLERPMRHGSASYHRSARTDKTITRDHALIFQTP